MGLRFLLQKKPRKSHVNSNVRVIIYVNWNTDFMVVWYENYFTEEVERLEKQLEQEEARIHKLEEDHSHVVQEANARTNAEQEIRRKEKMAAERITELEGELTTKNNLVMNSKLSQCHTNYYFSNPFS